MRAAAIPIPSPAPMAVASQSIRYSRQKSGQPAIGRRVALHAAMKPMADQKIALTRIAAGYVLESAMGAPMMRRPGAETTVPTSPAIALCLPPPNTMTSNDNKPIADGGTSAANGPPNRIRARYQRGPPSTGANVAPDSPPGRCAMNASYDHFGSASGHVEVDSDANVSTSLRTGWLMLAAGGAWWCALHPEVAHFAVVSSVFWVVRPFRQQASRSNLVACVMITFVLGAVAVQSRTANAAANDVVETSFTGSVRVVDDPQPYGASTRLIIDIHGDRCELWARRYSVRARLESVSAGQYLTVSGEIMRLPADRYLRVRWQHVVCEFQVEWLGDLADGSAMSRASNRVRHLVTDAGNVIGGDRGALFRGLVIGDDRDQPVEMLQRFRSGGLSHLTAVSGQNVALILAVATPLIRKLAPGAQVVSTLLIIGWFVLITRSEPSILRAGVMAAIAVIASSRGRRVDPVRVLSMAVIALIVVDPLLSASVGFHLSVGATFGVISIGPLVTSILPSPKVISVPIGVTLGAQVGVLIPALAVFQRAPLVALPANLLAVPVAGIVMMVGLPVAIIASLFPPLAQIMLPPIELGVWWVDIVARIAQRVEPASPIPGIVASLVVAALVVGVAVSRQLTRLRARHEG